MAVETPKIAILSVYNKTGILDLANGLQKKGVRQVHGGILARDTAEDKVDLANENIQMIDYVICNLYPFKETAQKINVTIPEAVEEIDIGGVTLLRAAAKNHARVTVLSDPNDYPDFLQELSKHEQGEISETSRQLYALKVGPILLRRSPCLQKYQAFEHTADYDDAISGFFRKKYASDGLKHLTLRYGTNPHQKPASAFVKEGQLPIKVLCGSPGYVNLLDSLNAWPLVKELKKALNLPAAASFKHVSPAGAAVGVKLSQIDREVCMVDDIKGIEDSPLAQAYARARGSDRVSSYGDVIALSDEVDGTTARVISREVSDGVIAPAYSREALEILSKKKGGKYLVLQIDETYEPSTIETRSLYGMNLQQHRNDVQISPQETFKSIVTPKDLSKLEDHALRDLTVATIALKYTQSNSVCYAYNGQVIGLGAGQQSRIHCTRLAGDKADSWWMRNHERARKLKWKAGVKRPDKSNAIDMLCSNQVPQAGKEKVEYEKLFEEVPPEFSVKERKLWMDELQQQKVVLSSDAFFPFIDNVLRAGRSGVKYIAAPMGSQADEAVVEACETYNPPITFVDQKTRLFQH
ncbi:uncharacterized protein KY384_004169 [Bacidia gigantensis]|uniref:uncharacterized protein n=1 Tax=Bacidia gigantensis TaxID=2732470 RepID=UPI001D04A71B|nr:uncharacterized protein KY384_004169 [Bacidia gigantensis]KAG8530812.1 hypothetical protein KY384_004169 [Bacidia gigantensis]